MMNSDELKNTIRSLVRDMIEEQLATQTEVKTACSTVQTNASVYTEDGFVPDVTADTIQEQFFVPNPHNREGYLKMKQSTPARLGIWRTGPRHITRSTLRFWADHAAAQNAVWSDVEDKTIETLGFIPLQSRAEDKAEYLKNPESGRRLSQSAVQTVQSKMKKGVQVQIVFADGLSSSAITKNAPDILPALEQSLQALGISYATPFFVKNGRVAVGDEIGEIVGCDVVVMLVGERPGLNSTSSMGAYVCYRPTIGMEESRRTVISNIHALGTVPVEAGSQIAELCQSMIQHKTSGVELKLVDK